MRIMTAKELAEQATTLAEKLKPGTWEAVQALALTSIAHSLVAMSEHRDDAWASRPAAVGSTLEPCPRNRAGGRCARRRASS
jgi:hypothetical protein